VTALAQAKLAYVTEVLDLCAQHHCKTIASIITGNTVGELPEDMLRRDYCYLFERFFYYLEDRSPDTMGIVVFDELEKSRSHLLVEQMDRYFKYTAKGRYRAGQVIPEPFFVHSDLTTGCNWPTWLLTSCRGASATPGAWPNPGARSLVHTLSRCRECAFPHCGV